MATPQFYVPGPVHIYFQHFVAGVASDVFSLGIANGGVRPRSEPIWEDAPNDGQGRAPGEATHQGHRGVISFTLTTLKWKNLDRLRMALPNTQSELSPGVYPAGSIGQLLIQGLNYFRVLLWLPYYSSARNPDMPQYMNYPVCRLVSLEIPLLAEEVRCPIVFEVRNAINYCTGAYTAYNFDGTGWPGSVCEDDT